VMTLDAAIRMLAGEAVPPDQRETNEAAAA
jgi:hypothetical protein